MRDKDGVEADDKVKQHGVAANKINEDTILRQSPQHYQGLRLL